MPYRGFVQMTAANDLRGKWSFNHFDDPPLISCTALATSRVAGRESSTWTWSGMPPTANALNFVGSGNAADVRPQLALHRLRDERLAILSREDTMDEETFVAMRHGGK